MTNRTFLTQGQLEQVAAHYGAAEQAVALEHEQWLLFMLGEEIFSLSMNELDVISEISSGVAIPSLKNMLSVLSAFVVNPWCWWILRRPLD
ncbi:hypothetical protein A9Q99_00200 [Gammaproteobacteria bacterium 45_16_T64]|nr:hypothetical protein A9Q99_00200 [Gammaproteobacteria bacterium 45_16_T64]